MEFSPRHQSVSLNIDLQECSLAGSTTILLAAPWVPPPPAEPAAPSLVLFVGDATQSAPPAEPAAPAVPANVPLSIALHCSWRISIDKVSIDGVETRFRFRTQPKPEPIVGTVTPNTPRSDFNLFLPADDNEEELEVDIPPSVQQRIATEPVSTPAEHTFSLLIQYRCRDPQGGVYFYSSTPGTVSHAYTENQHSSARIWLPCFDNPTDRCTWDFEIIASKQHTIIMSGDHFVERAIEGGLKARTARINSPIDAPSLAFAVGEFAEYPDLFIDRVFHYAPRSELAKVAHTVQFLSRAYDFYLEYLDIGFPSDTYQQVFLPGAHRSIMSSGLAFSGLSCDLLHPPSIIEEELEARRHLSHALAMQYFGRLVHARHRPDSWLVDALALHLTHLFLRSLMGVTNWRFQLREDMDFVCATDTDQPPISDAEFPSHLDRELRRVFVKRKGRLVLHMLEKSLGADALDGAIRRIFQTENDTGIVDVTFSQLLKLLKRNTVKDKEVKNLTDHYVYQSGCPIITCEYAYSRKRNVVELRLGQTSTCAATSSDSPRFATPVTLRVHETENSYEHIYTIEDVSHSFEFAYHSKAKKVRKPKPRLGEEAMSGKLKDMCDWQLLDNDMVEDSPVLWMRVDPDMQLICSVSIRQTDYQWRNQLLMDRDVVGQYNALVALRAFANRATSCALIRAIADRRVFYRVRAEIVGTVAAVAARQSDYDALKVFIRFFTAYYSLGTVPLVLDQEVEAPVMRPNRFTELSDYFVLKAIPSAVATIRDERGLPVADAVRLILCMLRFNDNTNCEYSDSYYIAQLVESLGTALYSPKADIAVSGDRNHISRESLHALSLLSIDEIERCRATEQLSPSYRHVVEAAALRALCQLQLADRIPLQVTPFILASKRPQAVAVRISALASLIRTAGGDLYMFRYIIHVAVHDPEPYIRFETTRLLVEWVRRAGNDLQLRAQLDVLKHNISQCPEFKTIIIDYVSDCADAAQADLLAEVLQSIYKHCAGLFLEDLAKTVTVDGQRLKLTLSVALPTPQQAAFSSPAASPAVSPSKKRPSSESKRASKKHASSSGANSPRPVSLMALLQADPTAVARTADGDEDDDVDVDVDDAEERAAADAAAAAERARRKQEEEEADAAAAEAAAVLGVFYREDMQMSRDDYMRASSVLTPLLDEPLFAEFVEPVDTDVLLDYKTIVATPMSLSTIRDKLVSGKYASQHEFSKDMALVWKNCRLYNSAWLSLTQASYALEERFQRLWHRAPTIRCPPPTPPTSSSVKLRFPDQPMSPVLHAALAALFKRMAERKDAQFYRDPYREPLYLQVIPEPRCITGIQSKLRQKAYKSLSAVETDVRIMIENSRYYNLSYSAAVRDANSLEVFFDDEVAKLLRPGHLQAIEDKVEKARKAKAAAEGGTTTPAKQQSPGPSESPAVQQPIKLKFKFG